MATSRNLAWSLLLAFTLAACGSSSSTTDAGDGGNGDAAPADTGTGDADDAAGTGDAAATGDAGDAATAIDASDGGTGDAATTEAGDAATTEVSDAATAEAGDAPATDGGDAASEAGAATTLDDGTYNATAWSCAGSSGTKDLKAFATSINIAEVHFTVAGLVGKTEAILAGTPACTRTTASTISYPAAGTFATTSAPAYTCSATCLPAACTSGAQPVIVDTFAFTKTATTIMGTRTLGTPIGFQAAAGCKAGDTESITYTKL
jgi:hypothetical protein